MNLDITIGLLYVIIDKKLKLFINLSISSIYHLEAVITKLSKECEV